MNRFVLFFILGLVYFSAGLPVSAQSCAMSVEQDCACACSEIDSRQASETPPLDAQVSQVIDFPNFLPDFYDILAPLSLSFPEFVVKHPLVPDWRQLGFILSERMLC